MKEVIDDDRGWHSLLGGRSAPDPLSGQGPIYDRFQNFLYDMLALGMPQPKEKAKVLRTRLESVGVRFSNNPWCPRNPNEWVFVSPLGAHLVIDKETAEKILVLGLP